MKARFVLKSFSLQAITELGPCSKSQISKKVLKIARESDALTDDLIEEITSATGWCIKSIDYRNVLS